jgi:hypothetical protein
MEGFQPVGENETVEAQFLTALFYQLRYINFLFFLDPMAALDNNQPENAPQKENAPDNQRKKETDFRVSVGSLFTKHQVPQTQ